MLRWLLGRSEPEPGDLDSLLARSVEDLRAKTAAHQAWGFGSEESWSFDQSEGNLVLRLPSGITGTAPGQIVGTLNLKDGTWMWSWANQFIEPALTQDARKLQEYGAKHSIEKLTQRKFAATEDDAWQLTALSAYLNKAQGAYRGPAGPAQVFFTFGQMQLSKTAADE